MAKLYVENKFGVIPTKILNDPDLSLRAKGLWVFIQSKPDGWKFSAERIALQTKEWKKGVTNGLQELEKLWLLERQKIKDKKWRWWILYILKDTKNPSQNNSNERKPSEHGQPIHYPSRVYGEGVNNSKKEIVVHEKKTTTNFSLEKLKTNPDGFVNSQLEEKKSLNINTGTENINIDTDTKKRLIQKIFIQKFNLDIKTDFKTAIQSQKKVIQDAYILLKRIIADTNIHNINKLFSSNWDFEKIIDFVVEAQKKQHLNVKDVALRFQLWAEWNNFAFVNPPLFIKALYTFLFLNKA